MVAFIAASIGTGASRVLNVSALCATPPSASNIPANTMIPGFRTDASLNFIMITEFDLPDRQRRGLVQASWRGYLSFAAGHSGFAAGSVHPLPPLNSRPI